jgi:hypothetical protein
MPTTVRFPSMPERRRVAIEQAIACGWPTARICDVLHVKRSDVERVETYLDAVNEEPTVKPRDRVLEQIARDETAAIYSEIVEESNSHAQRLAEGWTQWERHRLAVATLNLRKQARDAEKDTA